VKRSARVACIGASAVAVAACATAIATTSDTTHRFHRLDVGRTAAVKPALLDHRKTTVMLQLNGRPVAAYQAAARARGTRLTARQRAAIRARIASRQAVLAPRIAAAGGRVGYRLRDAYNGVSVTIARNRVARLASLPGVAAVRPTHVVRPALTTSVPFIGAPAAWGDFGYTGKGVKLGVIDTGLDYYHADFGGSGDPADFAADDGLTVGTPAFPNAKVGGGWDFVGDDYNAAGEGAALTPHPDPDPLDCLPARGTSTGHGTHVAGIAAGEGVLADGTTFHGPYDASTYANRTFKVGPGVAPEATLYSYRVFGCSGSVTTDIVVAAMDRALKDGVNVLNMSLGSTFGGPDDPGVAAADNLSKAGVAIAMSAGNESPSAYTVGSASTASSVLSVAAEDATPTLPKAQLSGAVSIEAQNSNDAAIPSGGITGPLRVLQDPAGTIALGCEAADYAGVQPGDIVVTVRGVCDRVARAKLAQQAGAAAAIMVNNADELPPLEGPVLGVTIPFLGVKSSDGPALLAADGQTVTVAALPPAPNPAFKKLAGFSSGGPRTGDSALKPDVTAPGVGIASALTGQGTLAQNLSGTSMASPHVAGVIALVKQAHPSWSSAQIKAAIMSTATADPSALVQTDVRLAGAGAVQPRKAVDTVAQATTDDGLDNLSFGYDPLGGAYTETRSFRITNDGSAPITYDVASAFDGSPRGATATLSASSVTVPAGGSAEVALTLSMDAAAIAALPPASDIDTPGAIATVQGAITATPTSTGAGVYPLRVPFLAVPRGLSDVVPGTPSKFKGGQGGVKQATVPVSNHGIHAGAADVYSWGLSDPQDSSAGSNEADVRSAGVQVLPGEAAGADPSDRLLVFAVNTYGRWSNAAGDEFDLPIDTNGDGNLDFLVAGVDLGVVTAGDFNGQMASFVFDPDGNIVDAFIADAPMNGSTVLLPVLASDLGLTSAKGSFSYGLTGFVIREDHVAQDDVDGTATFNAYAPAQSTGDFLELAPGAAGELTLTVDDKLFNKDSSKGWLVVSLDDANGGGQADRIPAPHGTT
jgi:minor extracellular serine protease Vpr